MDWKAYAFQAIFLLGIFFRVFHFSDWLFFKRDQARDAFAIWQAFTSGPGWLPLLGPNATGSQFFCGPIFYYFQYLATLLFQSAQPAVLAFPDLFWGILSILLFYIFAKKYFSREWSLIATAIFAVNFLAVLYSRFAWNPNSLPFFSLLFFYSLLNVFDSSKKDELRWPILAGLSFAVATQLHVLAEIALPVIAVAFLTSKIFDFKKYLNWKKTAFALGAFLLIYVPEILSEIVTHGKNMKLLFHATESAPYYSSFLANIFSDFISTGQLWFLVLTGYISPESEYRTAYFSWIFLILPALWLIFKFWRKEKSETKKNFLLIIILWFLGYFLVFLPVALHFQSRFFLPIIVLPIIFLVLVLNWVWKSENFILKIFCVAILIAAFFGNAAGNFLWFGEIERAIQGSVKPNRTIILKEQDGVVLWHLDQAAQYIASDCDKPFVYLSTSPEYGTPLEYVLKLYGKDASTVNEYDPNRPGCIYAFDPSVSGKEKITNSLDKNFDIIGRKASGVMRVYKLQLKADADLSLFDKIPKEKRRQILWKELNF
jgi:4-amino-4-deoxy-L-arabinose transferase-like glycosyltransferase